MPTSGGGPVQYIETNPCPPSNPQITLSLPALVTAVADDEQRRKIALVQLAFARQVSKLLAEAYADVEAILQAEHRAPDQGRV